MKKTIVSLAAGFVLAGASATSVSAQEYQVQDGDTLSELSQEFDVSVDDLKAWNDLDSDLIIVDQLLDIQNEDASDNAENQDVAPVNEQDQAEAPAESSDDQVTDEEGAQEEDQPEADEEEANEDVEQEPANEEPAVDQAPQEDSDDQAADQEDPNAEEPQQEGNDEAAENGEDEAVEQEPAGDQEDPNAGEPQQEGNDEAAENDEDEAVEQEPADDQASQEDSDDQAADQEEADPEANEPEGNDEEPTNDEDNNEDADPSEGETMTMSSTAYTAGDDAGSGTTADGTELSGDENVVAVDPDEIPLGSEVHVEGYGDAVAADTGGDINGDRIDLHMGDEDEATDWGNQDVEVTVKE